MPSWSHAPMAPGATTREQDVVNRAFHLADGLPDPRMVGPLRDAVELLVELIEARGKRQTFEDQWDPPRED